MPIPSSIPAASSFPDPTNFGNQPGQGPLRVGGESRGTLPAQTRDLPSTLSKSAAAQVSGLTIARDLAAGNERFRDKSTAYLPQDPGEKPQHYAVRLTRSVLFNAFVNTIEGLTGLVFARDPVLGPDVPPQIVAHWENIDNAGTHGDVFCRDLFADDLIAGHAAILVEFPATGGTQTADTEQGALPIRPYWVPIKKENILSWRAEAIDGVQVLCQVVLKETAMVPDGTFGEREQARYRVLYRDHASGVVGFVLLEVTPEKLVLQVGAGTYPTQTEIPLAEIISAGRVALFESRPPLLDLAYLNIAHYQQWSDYATSIHKTCVPIYVETGVDTQDDATTPVVIGPNSARRFSNPDAKAMYVSHSGASLDACKQSLDELKSDMATMGLSMLAAQKRTAETAAAKRIDKQATDSKLGVSARGLQDGIERALGFHANYLRLRDGGSITINRDFERAVMDAQTMGAYADLAQKMGLPVRVILEELQEGGRLPEEADLDALETEMLTQQAATAAAAAEAAQQNAPTVRAALAPPAA